MSDLIFGMMSSDAPIKALAVVGGAALGAMFIGWLVQVLAKLSFAQKIPPWPLRILRVLGGGATGLLVYWFVFGGGGGIGGPGGWLGGGHGGSGDKQGKSVARSANDKGSEKSKENKSKEKAEEKRTESQPAETMHVEVLGNETLMKIAKSQTYDPNKRYRIEGSAMLYTLEEVQKLILQKRKDKPPLRRLVVVVYRDSPAQDRPQVTGLTDWTRLDLDPERGKVEVDLSLPDQNAPID